MILIIPKKPVTHWRASLKQFYLHESVRLTYFPVKWFFTYYIDTAQISCILSGTMLTSAQFNFKVNPYSKYHIIIWCCEALYFMRD